VECESATRPTGEKEIIEKQSGVINMTAEAMENMAPDAPSMGASGS
jgi:hypothetical protein